MNRRRLKAACCYCLLILGLLMSSPGKAGQIAQGLQDQSDKDFQGLLERVKQSEPSVDFTRLRRLYSESSSYMPYGDDAEGDLESAVVAQSFEKAVIIARDILTRNYLNLEAHFAATVACIALGDAKCGEHHRYVAQGILSSIAKSGDGKTPATAYVVVATPEEYAVARVRSVRVEGQKLVQVDGHSYDQLTVRDAKTNAVSEVYFNVDLALVATKRIFGL